MGDAEPGAPVSRLAVGAEAPLRWTRCGRETDWRFKFLGIGVCLSAFSFLFIFCIQIYCNVFRLGRFIYRIINGSYMIIQESLRRILKRDKIK